MSDPLGADDASRDGRMIRGTEFSVNPKVTQQTKGSRGPIDRLGLTSPAWAWAEHESRDIEGQRTPWGQRRRREDFRQKSATPTVPHRAAKLTTPRVSGILAGACGRNGQHPQR